MPAKITNIIGPDNFELIRDQIGAVLLLELGNQAVLDNTFTAPDKVWIERFVPFNALTETTYVNVRYQKGDEDERSRERTQTHYTHSYFIECSVKAKSKSDITGDQKAAVVLHQLIRKIRSILSNPIYNTLGFDKPFNKAAWINSIEVFEPMEMQDATNQIDGRIEYCISVPEYAATLATGAPLNEVTATVKLYNTDEGYYWDYRQKEISISETGDTLTDDFFSNTIAEIFDESSLATYTAGVDFTQDGTTITATKFTFTSGQKIIART